MESEIPTKKDTWDMFCYPIYSANFEVIPKDPPDYFRAGHSCNYIPEIENSVFIYGGYSGPQEMYIIRNAHKLGTNQQDNEDVRWEKVLLTKFPGRCGHATFTLGKNMYIYAGYSDEKSAYSDMYQVNMENFATSRILFQKTVPNLDRRWHASFYRPQEHKFFVHAGWNPTGPLGDIITLNMETMEWEKLEMKDAPSPRRWHSLDQIPEKNNQYLLYGGYDGDFMKLKSDMHVLDLEYQKWIEVTTKGQKPTTGRIRHSVTVLDNKQLLFMGGYKEDRRLSRTAHILHLDDMSWQEIEEIGHLYPVIRSAHKVVKVNDYGHVVAGGIVRDFVEPFYYLDIRLLK